MAVDDLGWREDPLPVIHAPLDATALFPPCEPTEHWFVNLRNGLTCRRCGAVYQLVKGRVVDFRRE
jgi:hypothetical protein